MALTKIDDRGLKTPIDLLDNEKIRFGTGNDLEIYRDSNNSWIKDVTASSTLMLSSDYISMKASDGSENLLNATEGGAVELYWDGSKKLETISTGAQVNGANLNVVNTANAGDARLFLKAGETGTAYILFNADEGDNQSDNYRIYAPNGGPLSIQYDGGNWEDSIKCNQNGSTELYHDNSKKLETTSVGVNITDGEVRIGDAADGNDALIRLGATGSDADTHGVIAYDKSSNYLSLVVSGESHGGGGILIANGGNVGINEVSPSYQLDVKGDSGIYASAGSNSTAAQITISGRNSSGSGSALSRLKSYPDGSSNQSHFAIETRNSSATMVEAIRITSDQRVGIGTTSPSNLVHIEKSHADPLVVIKNTSGQANEGACLKLWASGRGSGVDDEDIFVINDTNNARNFGVSNAGTVNTTGNIVMASGKGINFSATSDAGGRTSELLDDYEEGTFSPTLEVGGSTTGVAYGHRSGSYTKVGRLVTINGAISLSSKGSNTGQIHFAGLPFTVADLQANTQHEASGSIGYFSGMANNTYFATITAIHSQDEVLFTLQKAHDTGVEHATEADIADNVAVRYSVTYLST